ncbi:MAG TPA: hypothetical protein VNZ22_03945, partial [Bacillota bacterium]|nr:hypothetical protein [Bacillota bacterium]
LLPAHAIVRDLKVKPDDSKVVLAATSEGLFRSEDEGKHWVPATNGLPHAYTEEIAFAPSRPQTVYVTLRCTAEDTAPWNGAVCRSDDAGQSWRTVNGAGLPKRVGKRGQARNLSSNPKELAVDPREPNTVYVGNRDWVSAGVYKTTDSGQHWNRVTRPASKESNMDYGWITMWGASVECLALSPVAPDRLAFGTSGHVFLSDDGGTSWRQRYTRQLPDGRFAGAGLEVTCAWRVVPDPVCSNRVYCCYMDIGLLISEDLGRTFRRSFEGMKMGGNCFGVVVDPQAPDTLWAATGQWAHNAGDICRSEDGGRTWRVVGHPASGLPDGQVLQMTLDLQSPLGKRRLLAICKGNGVVETRDGGQTWHSLNGNLPADSVKDPRGLLLDPEDSLHVVIAAGGNLYATRDGGSRWQRLNASGLPPNLQRLVTDPHSFQKLYVAARESYDRKTDRQYPGGAFCSEDGGQTWRHLLDCRFASDIAISPANSRILYVTTAEHPYFDGPIAQGLLKSTDGGETWHQENNGLSLQNLKAVCVSPHDPDTVFIATSGNSIFVGHDREVR